MDEQELIIAEIALDRIFGEDNWDVRAYNSPAERTENKPILPTTNKATNRMGHARNWPGPDTSLIEAVFWSHDGNDHRMVFTDVRDAINWLNRQNPDTRSVEL
jgi:hypothetical protein